MTVDEHLYQALQQLPDAFRQEVFDFVQYLLAKAERQEEMAWMAESLAAALQGMEEEEPLYTLHDLKVVFE